MKCEVSFACYSHELIISVFIITEVYCSINICVARAPNIDVKVLKQLYNALVESRMMTAVEIWGLEDGWKETGKFHELFCK
jgi:hypothetical protein